MKTPPDRLSEVLHGWRVDPPADPGFRPAVWQRIRRRANVSWPAYLRAHQMVWSLAAVAVLATAGLAGAKLARVRVQADREAMVVNYLVDLDPRVQAVLKP